VVITCHFWHSTLCFQFTVEHIKIRSPVFITVPVIEWSSIQHFICSLSMLYVVCLFTEYVLCCLSVHWVCSMLSVCSPSMLYVVCLFTEYVLCCLSVHWVCFMLSVCSLSMFYVVCLFTEYVLCCLSVQWVCFMLSVCSLSMFYVVYLERRNQSAQSHLLNFDVWSFRAENHVFWTTLIQLHVVFIPWPYITLSVDVRYLV